MTTPKRCETADSAVRQDERISRKSGGMEIVMGKRQTRSEAREKTFSLIFQLGQNDEDIEFLIEQLFEEYPESVDNAAYIKGTLYGVAERREELISVIAEVLPANRKIDRLSKTVLSILLLAVYEMKYSDDVPEKVAINEAVELAKKFAEDEAPQFVNGVLAGVIAKQGE